MNSWDIVIIGAGPAGMSAAIEARSHAASVFVLDEHSYAGGQIYKGASRARPALLNALGPSYSAGARLIEKFAESGTVHETRASVWHIDAEGIVVYSKDGRVHRVVAKRIVIATGAQERPFPVPGWTLPGVMSAGAAQIALKTSQAAAPGAVFVGRGPLLFLIAAQYARLGVRVRAVIETTRFLNYVRAVGHPYSGLSGARYIVTGLELIWTIRRAGIPIFFGASDVQIEGEDKVESLTFRQGGRWRRIDRLENVFLHQGVIPNLALAAAAGCRRSWDKDNLNWTIDVDQYGRSSQPRIFLAGDAATIIGADCAPVSGELAALAAAHQIALVPDEAYRAKSARLIAELRRKTGSRAFFEVLYRPTGKSHLPDCDGTVICRCEDIKLSDVRQFVAAGGFDVNQFKSESRCGMGPCQGRMCGLTLSSILARELDRDPRNMGPQRVRPPVTPVPLKELATLLNQPETQ